MDIDEGQRQTLGGLFPLLRTTPYEVIGPADETYNCVARAAGDTARLWWPLSSPLHHWPCEPREETVDGFVRAFTCLGFEPCDSRATEPGYGKVAVYAIDTDDPEADEEMKPTHMASQRDDGQWVSKLGAFLLIAHPLDALEGPLYGRVVQVMRRPARGPTIIEP